MCAPTGDLQSGRQPKDPPIVSLIGIGGLRTGAAVAAFFLLAGGSVAAQGTVPPAAPWFVCYDAPALTPDKSPIMPQIWGWDWGTKKFKPSGPSANESNQSAAQAPSAAVFAVLIDDTRQRAMYVTIDKGVLSPSEKYETTRVLSNPPPGGGFLFEIDSADQPDSSDMGDLTLTTIAISGARAADGRFAALGQYLSVDFGILAGPEAIQAPMTCATTADSGLKQQIEKTRAEWLTKPAGPRPQASRQ